MDAFEEGILDAADVKDRISGLRTTHQQLRDRRDLLTLELADQPTMPDTATLAEVSANIGDIVRTGSISQRKP
jgi:hypothetical protein